MSFNGLAASFLPFTINGLTDATFSNSNIGNAVATTLQLTSATPLKLARFNADRELVSASVDESQVALLVGNNVFNGSQTILPGSVTNINNVITTAITSEAYTEADFTTSGISGYTAPLGTLSGPTAGEYSIGQTANDRTIMKINGFVPTEKIWVYSFVIRIVDAAEGYLSVEQSGVQRSSTLRLITSELTTVSDTFTYDPTSGPIVFKIYTGSLDPWSASWSSFTLGSYTAAITAPLSAPLVATAISTTTIGTEILAFPLVSSVNSEAWSVYAISTMGDPSSLGGLIFQEATLGVGAYITGGVVGAKSFRFNTLSGDAGKVVVTNGDQVMSTSISAGQLQYITGLTSQAGGIGQTNTWTGANDFTGTTSVGALRITSSVANADYSLSVNPYDQLEFTNQSNGSVFKTNGADLFVTGSVSAGTLGATNVEAGSNIYLAKGSTAEWRTTLGMSDEYEILDNAGVMRSRLSKSTGLTVSSMKITNVPSATPSVALGLNGGGSVVSFVVPTTSGLVPYTGATTTVNLGAQSIYATTARFTGVTSATPSLALGVDVSGNLNTFTVPTGTNILPLNNTFTGTNQFNNSVIVYNGLGVASGAFTKQTATAGSLAQITGGGASSSPYVEFLFGGSSRGIIGSTTVTDMFIASQNGAQINFATAGTNRMTISTTGVVTVPNDVVANGLIVNGGGSYVAGCIYSDANWGMLFRAKVVPSAGGGIFLWNDSAGAQKMKMLPSGVLELTTPAGGPGFVQTNGTIIVETYIGGSGGGGWFGTRSNHPLLFYANNSSARITIEPSLGYVAIGNFTPSYKLHVGGADGNIRAEGAIYCNAYYGSGGTRSFVMDETNAVNWIGNNTGPKPLTWNPTTWGNNGYTVITPLQTVNSPGLGLGGGSHSSLAGGRSVIISLAPAVAWGELILSGSYIYTSCYGTLNNYTNGGGWVYISDKRCKKDIKDIKTARSLQRIMMLKPKTYKKIYNPEKTGTPVPQEVIDANHVGFLAQDVMETNPHCVSEWVDDNCVCDDDDGKRLGIAYGDINIHMVGAIQELKKQNDAQQKQIDELKALVQQLLAK